MLEYLVMRTVPFVYERKNHQKVPRVFIEQAARDNNVTIELELSGPFHDFEITATGEDKNLKSFMSSLGMDENSISKAMEST